MKKRLFTWLIFLFALNASAQVNTGFKTRGDFFKQPHFKNGKAVLTFKVFYAGFHEAPPLYKGKDPRMHKTLLNIKIRSNSCINFYIQGDTTIYDAPYVSNNPLVNKLAMETPVYLTIVVFKHYAGYQTKHFFVVTNISIIQKKKKPL